MTGKAWKYAFDRRKIIAEIWAAAKPSGDASSEYGCYDFSTLWLSISSLYIKLTK